MGKRVAFEDHFGTIRYVGEVPPTKGKHQVRVHNCSCSDRIGVWLGVEWDDPQRGKHSGTHEGVEYFSCSVEGSGSFLRHRRAELGCTFIQAVREVGVTHQWDVRLSCDRHVIVMCSDT